MSASSVYNFQKKERDKIKHGLTEEIEDIFKLDISKDELLSKVLLITKKII